MLRLASGEGEEGGHTNMPVASRELPDDWLHVLQDLVAPQLGIVLEVPGNVLHCVALGCLQRRSFYM